MVGFGEAKTAKDISHPFTLKKGWFSARLTMGQAENLRDWLTEQLSRADARYPIEVALHTSMVDEI
jgi:hypothetical protein